MVITSSLELRVGLAAWATFIAATCVYCLLYQAFVSAVTPDLARTLGIALREWGAWALLAPWALRIFGAHPPWPRAVASVLLLALLAACLPILADQITHDRHLGASLALFWPRNVALALALLILARVFARSPAHPAIVAAPTPTASATAAQANVAALASTLLVSKGVHQCLIHVDDIRYVSASGNYVEIRARDEDYLLRSTLGELAASLPSDQFVRIHRSHLVRIQEIGRIRVERSGSGLVQLRGGGELPISKACRAQLRAMNSSRQASVQPKPLE